jgi:hypothetical protein
MGGGGAAGPLALSGLIYPNCWPGFSYSAVCSEYRNAVRENANQDVIITLSVLIQGK